MHFTLSLLFIFLLSPFVFASDLHMSLGQVLSLPLKGQNQVWIEDSKIIQAIPLGRQLQLKSRKEGTTSVRVGSDTYTVHVLHPDAMAAYLHLKDKLKNQVGLKPQVQEGQLIIEGQLYRLKDWIQFAQNMDKSTITYQMRAQLSSTIQKESQKYFNQLFDQAKIPPQAIVFSTTPEVRISGNDNLFKKYLNIMRPFGIQVLKDEQSIDIAPTIKVQITVAEVSKELTQKYGIAWPGSFQATLLKTPEAILNNLDMELQALEISGHGKILASPNIICRSGKEAEFLAGGEFPIKVLNYKIQDIVWKRYGILLKVKPKADTSGRMSIALETEVSRVDESRKVDDIPGILTNKVSSHFDLTGPQTIALSGLIKNEEARQSQGLPGIANIPILGALFSSKNFKENKTELIIFVRPSILHEGQPDSDHATPLAN